MKKCSTLIKIFVTCFFAAFAFVGCNSNEEPCAHTYDNACDVTCNVCSETREVGAHDYEEADCDTPKTCTVCGATEGEALGHSPNADDGDCTTAVTCSECGTVTTEAKAAHSPNADDGDCTTAITCSECGTVTTEAKAAHSPNADDGDCTTAITCIDCEYVFVAAKEHAVNVVWNATDIEHWHACANDGCLFRDSYAKHEPKEDDGDCTTAILCKDCNWVLVKGNESHTSNEDDGDCTTAVTCSECETVTTEAKASHEGEDDGDCTTAVQCTVCNTVITPAKEKHEDENLDGACDNCTVALDYVYDEDTQAYIVFTAEGLYAWTEDSWKGLNLTLGKDIAMPTEMMFDLDGDEINDSNWDPQRCWAIIDGNGYSITGLVIKSTVTDSIMGFVSSLDEGGVIKNLRLLDAEMSLVGINCGILVGYNNGTIENCGVSGSLYVEGNNVAGIAGTNSGTIIACYNDANITATVGILGGIVGQNASEGTITACYNTGEISSNSSSVGGIVGALYSGSIISCYNAGTVVCNLEVGLVIGYSGEDTTNSTNYASVNVNNAEGIPHDNCTVVDGETIAWSDAMTAMNTALETAGTNWRYVENTGTDSAIHPLVLNAVSQTENA